MFVRCHVEKCLPWLHPVSFSPYGGVVHDCWACSFEVTLKPLPGNKYLVMAGTHYWCILFGAGVYIKYNGFAE